MDSLLKIATMGTRSSPSRSPRIEAASEESPGGGSIVIPGVILNTRRRVGEAETSKKLNCRDKRQRRRNISLQGHFVYENYWLRAAR